MALSRLPCCDPPGTPVEDISPKPEENGQNIFVVKISKRDGGNLPKRRSSESNEYQVNDGPETSNPLPVEHILIPEDDEADQAATQSENYSGIFILQTYFRLLYYYGLGAYHPDAVGKLTYNMQLILFSTVSFLSVLHVFEQVKTQLVGDTDVGNAYGYIMLAFYILNAYVRLTYFDLTLCKKSALGQLIGSFKKTMTTCRNTRRCKLLNLIPFLLLALSSLDALVRTLFMNADFYGWSMEDAVLWRAFRLRRAFSLWSTTSWRNDTLHDHFNDKTQQLTFSNAVIGGVGMTMEFLSCQHQNACTCIFLLTTVCLIIAMSNLKFTLNDHGILEQVDHRSILNKDEEEEIWANYKHLMKLSKCVDTSFSSVFTGCHIFNLLSFGYLLCYALYDSDKGVLYNCFCSYFRQCEAFHRWVRQNYYNRDVVINNEAIKTSLLLEDLVDHPVGIGMGLFYVDDGFALKFISVAASYFVFISEKNWKFDKMKTVYLAIIILLLTVWTVTGDTTTKKMRDGKKANNLGGG